MTDEELREIVKAEIKSYSDFPKPGILFRDVFPILGDPKLFANLMHLLVASCRSAVSGATVLAGLESRGFLFGPALGLQLGLPFVPIRKSGKLPGPTKKISFALEYGSDEFEIQENAIPAGASVVIVDDLLATGGSMAAACKLVESVGGVVSLCLVVIELVDLKGNQRLAAPFTSIVKF